MKKSNYTFRILSGGLIATSLVANVQELLAQNNAKQEDQKIVTSPNVVFILCDDLGFSDIEAYGNQIISTPNINKLVNRGMSFTQFYAASTVSAPSRASLLTGQHVGYTKIRGNKEIYPEGQEPLDPSVKVIPQLFKQAGYTTGAFGKWGLGYPGSGSEPTDVGFDKFYGYNCQRESHSYYPGWLYDNKTKVTFNGAQYSADSIQQAGLRFIRDNKDKHFFAFLAYTLPHAGLEQPKDSIYNKYADKFCETNYGGDSGSKYAAADKPRAQFAGMVSRLDAYVGQVVAELEKQGILNNTLLIFTSDNGPHTEGGGDPNFFNTEKLLRGFKRSLYEGGVRVPFIAVWPGHIPAGVTTNQVAAGWDMMATFNEMLGQQATWTQATQGLSVLPTLINQGTQAQHDHLYFEFHEENGRQMVRKGEWVLIRQNVNTTPALELYNLDQDLYENNNLANQYPDKVQELKTIMDTDRTSSTMFGF